MPKTAAAFRGIFPIAVWRNIFGGALPYQQTPTIMNTKPVKPIHHGIIDYIFSTIQMSAPAVLGLNKKVVKTYATLGAGFLAVNAFTDTPVGLAKKLSFKTHQKLDASFLATLAGLSFTKSIRKDKRALAFHLAFLATAAAHYMLTDYDA